MNKLLIFLSLFVIINSRTNRQIYQPIDNIIVLVPGIGGSRLYSVDKTTGFMEKVWISSTDRDGKVNRLMSIYDMIDGELFNESYQILTSLELCGLASIDNLNPGGVTEQWTEYYHNMIQQLVDVGYEPCVNLFGLPYDWRYAPTNKILLKGLHHKLSLFPDKKKVVISHSMGGLVVDEYIRFYGDGLIDKWYPISTPFHGASSQYSSFIGGNNLGNPFLSKTTAKLIALTTESAYYLLPQKKLIPQPELLVKVNGSWQKTDLAQQFSSNENFHPERIVERDCVNYSTKIIYITTSTQNTPHDFMYDKAHIEYTFTQGDGTVPLNSAFNMECDETSQKIDLGINTDHIGILKQPLTTNYIVRNLNQNCIAYGEYVSNSNASHRISIKNLTKVIDINLYIDGNIGFENEYVFVGSDCMGIQSIYDGSMYSRIIGKSCKHAFNKPARKNCTTSYCLYEYCVYGELLYKYAMDEHISEDVPDNLSELEIICIIVVIIAIAMIIVLAVMCFIQYKNKLETPNGNDKNKNIETEVELTDSV